MMTESTTSSMYNNNLYLVNSIINVLSHVISPSIVHGWTWASLTAGTFIPKVWSIFATLDKRAGKGIFFRVFLVIAVILSA